MPNLYLFVFRSVFQWINLIPLGLIVMNAMTQAMNMPEEQASGQPGSQTQQTGAAVQRGQTASVRRGLLVLFPQV